MNEKKNEQKMIEIIDLNEELSTRAEQKLEDNAARIFKNEHGIPIDSPLAAGNMVAQARIDAHDEEDASHKADISILISEGMKYPAAEIPDEYINRLSNAVGARQDHLGVDEDEDEDD